jgi:hypothetical protein
MATEKNTKTDKSNPKPTLKPKKPLPSVAYLLAHGDPETAHLPRTWCQKYGYPIVLAIVFAISLLTFHYAPHHNSKHKPFVLPQHKQMHKREERIPQQTAEDVPPLEADLSPQEKDQEL